LFNEKRKALGDVWLLGVFQIPIVWHELSVDWHELGAVWHELSPFKIKKTLPNPWEVPH
jgi:hypothetical protein